MNNTASTNSAQQSNASEPSIHVLVMNLTRLLMKLVSLLDSGLQQPVETPAQGESVSMDELRILLRETCRDHRERGMSATLSILDKLARALLLSRNAEAFEPAIRETIRYYRYARDDIQRIEADPAYSESQREDIVAGLTRLQTPHRQNLKLMHVGVEEVEEGAFLDCDQHQVVSTVSTDEPHRNNTVRRCVSPAFCWTSPHGVKRREAARVEVWLYNGPDESESLSSLPLGEPEPEAESSVLIYSNESPETDDAA